MLIIQIALALLVVQGIRKKNFKFVLVAGVCQLLINAPLSFLASSFGDMGLFIAELYILTAAIVAFFFIKKTKILMQEEEAEGEVLQIDTKKEPM